MRLLGGNKMKYLIIPNVNQLEDYKALSDKGLGFEYNDFFMPENYKGKTAKSLIKKYQGISTYQTMHGPFFDICVNSYDEEMAKISKKRISKSLEIATKLSCKKIIFHSNINPFIKEEKYINNWLVKNGDFYRLMCQKYPDIIICIENMFDDNPQYLLDICNYVNCPNFKICFDVAHAFITTKDVMPWLDLLKPYISHIHINDNDGFKDSHLPLGKGIVPYKDVLEKITNEDVTVLIEVNNLENVKESLCKLKEEGFYG